MRASLHTIKTPASTPNARHPEAVNRFETAPLSCREDSGAPAGERPGADDAGESGCGGGAGGELTAEGDGDSVDGGGVGADAGGRLMAGGGVFGARAGGIAAAGESEGASIGGCAITADAKTSAATATTTATLVAIF